MSYKVVASKYTEKEVKKLLTLKRSYKLIYNPADIFMDWIGMLSICLFITGIFSIFLLYSCDDDVILFFLFGIILPLCAGFSGGLISYHELIGKNKKIVLGYYREADWLCNYLLTEQIKSGLFKVNVCVDTQNDELFVILKGNYLETKQTYHFGKYLKQIIDEDQKVIDLSKLDKIFGLEDMKT